MAGVELPNSAPVHKTSHQQSEKKSFPNTNLDRLGKTGRYPLLAGGCPTFVVLTQLPFAVEMWAQMDQITNTAWKNTCGTLPGQLQQWHPCKRKWKQRCLSGECRPHKSFSARFMVGLSECSLLAADITDLTFKMLLNISAAKHLWKCVVSEAWSSLA